MVGWRNDKSSKADDYQLVVESSTPLIIILAALGAGLWAWVSQGANADPFLRRCELVIGGALGSIVPRGHRSQAPPAAMQQRPTVPPAPRPLRPLGRQPIDNPDSSGR